MPSTIVSQAMREMTAEYASPEQVCGTPVTPASDIYSLGVVLYELLTGHRPRRFKNRAPHEIARVICEQEPDPPSLGVTRADNLVPTDPGKATMLIDVFLARGTANIESLKKELAGDLEKIILKCLRKEPAERYEDSAELAADITRYLVGKPVRAEARFPVSEPPAHAANKKNESITLAVLPLKVIGASGDTSEDGYLSIGLADALVTRLSNMHRLLVRPTSSILPFNQKQIDAFAAGAQLNVDFVLDGILRRSGKRIRVTAQLLSVKEKSTVWARQFDEDFTDVLDLEDSVSERVVKSIMPHLTADEELRLKKRGTDNPEAFEAYLRGRHYWNSFTEEGFAKALIFYNQAISIAPDYALAYAGIADYYNFLGVYAVLPFAETSAAAKEAAQKAIGIDPYLAEAHAALGFAVLMHDFDWTTAERHLRSAVEISPNYALARVWYCYFLGFTGRFDEAMTPSRSRSQN